MAALWITDQNVVDLVSLNDAIEALAGVLPQEAGGSAANGSKSLVTWDKRRSLHALTAMVDGRYCGTKTWINTPEGAHAVFALFDARAGTMLAMIEAAALGMMRTAGINGLAARLLAPKDADTLAFVGSGRQAFLQIAAVTACLPLRGVRLFSRSRENQLRFAEELRARTSLDVSTPTTIRDTLRDAPLITLATRAEEPFVAADMLADDVHINAVGAVLPAFAELGADVVARANRIVVDNRANVQRNARELQPCFEPSFTGPGVETIGELLAGTTDRGPGLSIFKSVGMGLSDLAVAAQVYDRAVAAGVGTLLPPRDRAAPRWTPAEATTGPARRSWHAEEYR